MYFRSTFPLWPTLYTLVDPDIQVTWATLLPDSESQPLMSVVRPIFPSPPVNYNTNITTRTNMVVKYLFVIIYSSYLNHDSMFQSYFSSWK